MEVVVRACDGLGGRAVDRCHAFQRVEATAQGADHRRHACAVTADDALGRCIDDQQIDALLPVEYAAHGCGGAVHDAHDPIHGFVVGQAPGRPHALTPAGEVIGEERALHQPREHLLAVAPGAQGEEPGGLAQAVTEHAARFHTEGAYDVADNGAQGDLRDDERPVVVADVLRGGGRPEAIGQELLRQVEVLRILTSGDLRPLDRQLAAHAQVVIA